jgi:hypothetical protein
MATEIGYAHTWEVAVVVVVWVIRGASEIASIEFSRRTNVRRRRPGVRPTEARTRSKYPKL